MIAEKQLPARYRAVIEEQLGVYNQGRHIEARSHIPHTADIPIENPRHWLKIPDVVCVFVDMKGSTQLSAGNHDESTAGAYQLFTGTAVRLFDAFETPYIDVRGDGVFGIFNHDQTHRALATAVTFKTFVSHVFLPTFQQRTTKLNLGVHVGIDRKTVLVRKVGMKSYEGRSDRQNEVWAGKPVNMAAKLASISNHGQVLVSDRYYQSLISEHALTSCGCVIAGGYTGQRSHLWRAVDVTEKAMFDFDIAYATLGEWCITHGAEFCDALLRFDEA